MSDFIVGLLLKKKCPECGAHLWRKSNRPDEAFCSVCETTVHLKEPVYIDEKEAELFFFWKQKEMRPRVAKDIYRGFK